MPLQPASLALLLGAATAAPPALVPLREGAVELRVPEGWSAWINEDEHNATATLGLATSLRLYWFGFKERLSNDRVLDIVLQTTRENVPFGEVVELSRHPAMDGAAGALLAEYRVWGYRMRVGIVALNDAMHDRMTAAVMLTDPDTFDDLDGLDLTARVVASLRTEGDARAEALALDPPERLLYDEPAGSLRP